MVSICRRISWRPNRKSKRPPSSSESSDTRRLRMGDGHGWNLPLVLRVDAASDAAAKGLAPGDQVLMLNRFQPDRSNLWRVSYFYRYIRPQAQQRLVVRKPDATERTL